ncbi:MAG: histidine phosphatase family protein [Actinomycetota bacterium]|nr:histidine phosphatase family protein [Actinomycetota bacterium]
MAVIELVRHAQAHGRRQWTGRPDRERPLTAEGRRQAAALAEAIAVDGAPAALVSSPYTRCVQTLEPLSDLVGCTVDLEEGLGEAPTVPVLDGGDPWVASAWLGGRALGVVGPLVRRLGDRRVVACSHGDVIPALVTTLIGRDGLELSDARLPMAGRFVLRFDGERCVDAHAHGTPGP